MKIKYRPGASHFIPDFLSRNVHVKKLLRIEKEYTDNWKLNEHWFQTLEQVYGPHDIDVFADKNNHQLPVYGSLDGTGVGDAFDIDWGN